MNQVDQLALDFSVKTKVGNSLLPSANVIRLPVKNVRSSASDLAKVYSAIEESVKHIQLRSK
jgi:hypothetical protein